MKHRRVLILTVAAVMVVWLVLADFVGPDKATPPLTPIAAELPKKQVAGARDWPMFGGSPSRNLVHPLVTNLPVEWLTQPGKEKNIKWVAELGSRTESSPVIADGKVFIGTNNARPRSPADVDKRGVPLDLGVLMCFREADGAFLWQAVHPRLPSGLVNDWPRSGIATPTVDGRRLYYVSNRCELICAETDTGRALWRLDMIKELGVFPHNKSVCAPLVVGDLVFVVTSNGVDEGHIDIPAPKAPSFLAVQKNTGKVVWQNNAPTAKVLQIKASSRDELHAAMLDLRNHGEVVMHGQWSNPTYAKAGGQEQVIFPGGDGWLRAFDPPTGRLLWKFDANPKNAKYALGLRGTRSDFMGTPVVADGRLYFSVGQDPEYDDGVGHLWCVDLALAVAKGARNADHDVSAQQNNFDPKAAVNQNAAFAWHFGGEVPLTQQAAIGRRLYFARSLSTCTVADGLVYAADLGGFFHCLDAKTGQHYWTHDLLAACWSSPFCADGKVYVGSDDGTVFVFAHDKEMRLLAQNDMDARVRAIPVAANGVLYVATESRLFAIAK
jgi:outer membrane protein assembly factor BamB